MAPALAGLGHEVHVLSGALDVPHRDEVEGGVQYHYRPRARIRLGVARLMGGWFTRDLLETSLTDWRLLRALGPFDVVEAPDWGGEGLLPTWGSAPLVINLHSPMAITARYNGWKLGRDLRLEIALEKVAVGRASAVTAVSGHLVRTLEDMGWQLPAAVDVIWNPAVAPPAPATVRESPPVVAVVGRLEAVKGTDRLVAAAGELAAIDGLARVEFAGGASGAYRRQMEAEAERLGAACAFLGHLGEAELDGLYRRARVCAVASRSDSQPMGAIQAMSYGVPVVTVASTGTAELVERSGGGTVVHDPSPASLAAALARYLADPELADRHGQAARSFALQELSPERIAARRAELYFDLVKRR